jgi:hypothetical protein
MSCSRHSSAIDFGPRSDASTISVFCCAVNFRYFLVSLNAAPTRLSGPSSEQVRTEGRLRRRIDPDSNDLRELSTPLRVHANVNGAAFVGSSRCMLSIR